MNNIKKYLLPQWARNPLLDYEWFHHRVGHARRRFVLQLLLLGILLAGAALFLDAATTGSVRTSQSAASVLWGSLYFPALTLQTLTAIAALLLGAAAFDAQAQGNTWDNLRVTESGAGLALRARWLGILYRLRAPIAAILLVRLILALGILSELTAFGGGYLQMLNADAATAAPDWRVIPPIIALILTAGFLLPLSLIASFAALGILTAFAIKDRLFAAVAQVLLVLTLLVFVTAASLAVSLALQDEITLPGAAAFLLFLGYSSYGDWGLALLQLGSLGAVWQHAPFGIIIGPGLAGLSLTQALIADGLMSLAQRLLERQN